MDQAAVLSFLREFALSPGFGGLAVLVAASVAWATARAGRKSEREIAQAERTATAELARAERASTQEAALENDARNRWWELARWTDNQIEQERLSIERILGVMNGLDATSTTSEQAVMLVCLIAKLEDRE